MNKYNIGDKVTLTCDIEPKPKVYIVYSYTTYEGDRVEYTVWNGEDYNALEWWQLQPYTPPESLGFTNTNLPTIGNAQ